MITVENLNQIIYESIDENYGFGKYGDFQVIIRKKDGYINATKLCKDGGKELKHWKETQYNTILFQKYTTIIGVDKSTPIMETNISGHLHTRGTYVHPILIPHIASWVSAEFAIRVSYIVNNFIVREYKEQLRIKDTRIDELLNEVKSQSLEIHQQTAQIQLLLAEVGDLSDKLDVSNENVVSVLDKLGAVSQQSVPYERIPPRNRECFVILDQGQGELPYIAIRAQRYVCQQTIQRKRMQYPQLREVVFIEAQPNAREFYIAFRRKLLGNIFVRGNKFRLEEDFTEAQLVELVHAVNAQKMENYREERSRLDEPIEGGELPHTTAVQAESLSSSSLLLKTIKSLQQMARDHNWKGWAKLRKPALVNFILERAS